MHPIMRTLFHARDGIFQDDNCFMEQDLSNLDLMTTRMKCNVYHGPNLNVIELLCSIFEHLIRNRYIQPAALPKLSQHLEEW